MSNPVNEQVLEQLFFKARSFSAWQNKPVSDELLSQLYNTLIQGPTSNNCCPARFVFLRSDEAKQNLLPALKGHNDKKVSSAPVTALIAYDSQFYELLPELFKAYDASGPFRNNPQLADQAALRNSSLQGAYFMLAARALGLDCGPMSGFDPQAVNDTFFPDGRWKINFLCSIGYGDSSALYPKGPRPCEETTCEFL